MQKFHEFLSLREFQDTQTPQTNQGGVNNRQAMMLRFVNLTQRANLPITVDSYDKIGRSAGYLKFVTESDVAWNAFISSKEFLSLLENMNDDSRKKIATEVILYVKRFT